MDELQVQHISHVPRVGNDVADAMEKHKKLLAYSEDDAMLLPLDNPPVFTLPLLHCTILLLLRL